MMSKLGLDEGDALELQSVKLPKGAFVQLKPELESWKENPSRELYVSTTPYFLVLSPVFNNFVRLEYQLRNYQSLTTNDTIKIQIKGHAYDLKVVSVRAVGEKELETENKEEGKEEQQKENEGNILYYLSTLCLLFCYCCSYRGEGDFYNKYRFKC